MEVLSSRVLVRATDFERSRRFYGETLGLHVYREYGEGSARGVVFFLGGGFLELSGGAPGGLEPSAGAPVGAGDGGPGGVGGRVGLWLQVRDLDATHADLAASGVDVTRPPARMPWGLHEMWIRDPDGLPLVVVQVPDDHPLRRRTG